MKELKNFSAKECNNDFTDDELLEGVVGKYKNKSEEELINELNKAVKNAKDDGSFDEESLENFAQLVSPHLSDAQREKLCNLIAVIKQP